jgi:UDP-glucose 4-epimerase
MINIVKLVNSFPVLPFGKIANRRNFTYIENLVSFIDRTIEKKASGIFIVQDEKAISTTELVYYLSKYLGRKVILFKLPQIFVRMGIFFIPVIFERLYGSLEVDNNKTKSELDYRPPFSTEEGIRKMVMAYKKRENS